MEINQVCSYHGNTRDKFDWQEPTYSKCVTYVTKLILLILELQESEINFM